MWMELVGLLSQELHVLTLEAAFLKRRVRTQVAAVWLLLRMPCNMHTQFRLITVRNPTFITDVWTYAEVNLTHVLVKTATSDNSITVHYDHLSQQPASMQ